MASNEEYQQREFWQPTIEDVKRMMDDVWKEMPKPPYEWIAICQCDETGFSQFYENFQKAMMEAANKL